MNIKTISKFLIGLGLLTMIIALNMDVSVGSVVNLHKISQQNNLLLLGGILFIAGIILFSSGNKISSDVGANTSNQTNVDSASAVEKNLRLKVKIDDAADSVKRLHGLAKNYFIGKSEGLNGIAIRISVALVIGVNSSIIIHDFFYQQYRDALSGAETIWASLDRGTLRSLIIYSEWIPIVFIVLSLRNRRISAVFRNLVYVNMLVFIVVCMIIVNSSYISSYSTLLCCFNANFNIDLVFSFIAVVIAYFVDKRIAEKSRVI